MRERVAGFTPSTPKRIEGNRNAHSTTVDLHQSTPNMSMYLNEQTIPFQAVNHTGTFLPQTSVPVTGISTGAASSYKQSIMLPQKFTSSATTTSPSNTTNTNTTSNSVNNYLT